MSDAVKFESLRTAALSAKRARPGDAARWTDLAIAFAVALAGGDVEGTKRMLRRAEALHGIANGWNIRCDEETATWLQRKP